MHDASIDDQHLYNQCQLILDYMVLTWGPEIEDLLDTHSGRQQFGIPLLKRRLDALFSVLEEGNLLCAATQVIKYVYSNSH